MGMKCLRRIKGKNLSVYLIEDSHGRKMVVGDNFIRNNIKYMNIEGLVLSSSGKIKKADKVILDGYNIPFRLENGALVLIDKCKKGEIGTTFREVVGGSSLDIKADIYPVSQTLGAEMAQVSTKIYNENRSIKIKYIPNVHTVAIQADNIESIMLFILNEIFLVQYGDNIEVRGNIMKIKNSSRDEYSEIVKKLGRGLATIGVKLICM